MDPTLAALLSVVVRKPDERGLGCPVCLHATIALQAGRYECQDPYCGGFCSTTLASLAVLNILDTDR